MRPPLFFREASSPNKIALLALTVLIIGMAVLSFQAALDRPFSLDETDITRRAHGITQYGPDGMKMSLSGSEWLTHPPLYEYTIALVFKLFGETEAAARGLGVLIFIVIGVLMLLTLDHLLKDRTLYLRQWALVAAAGLYLVNPLLIQHSLLIDADSTCIALFTMAFFYGFIRFEEATGRAYLLSRLALAAILALAFLSKEITPFFLMVGVALYRLINREWRKGALDGFIVLFGGLLLASVVWGVYCFFTATDFFIFIKKQYNWRVADKDYYQILYHVLTNMNRVVRFPVYWVTSPFFMLLFFVLAQRLSLFWKRKRLRALDYGFLASLIIWFPYLILKPSHDMMKYQQPVYPYFIVLIVYFLTGCLERHEPAVRRHLGRSPLWLWGTLLAGAGAAYYYYAYLGDYIIYLFDPPYAARWKSFMMHYYFPIAGLLLFLSGLAVWKKFSVKKSLVFGCLFFIFPISAALNVRQMRADYTTVESWLNYAERGLKETVDYLSSRVGPGEAIACRKDIYYYLRDRHGIQPLTNIGVRDIFAADSIDAFDKLIRKFQPRYLVYDRVSMVTRPIRKDVGVRLLMYYDLEEHINDFRIFRAKFK